MHPYVELARRAIEEYIKNKKTLDLPQEIPDTLKKQAGVFVCLKKQGLLCGCIGTFLPTTSSIYEEIVRNAVAAATQDPRFCAVQEADLKDLECSVDVLSPPEKVADLSELDAKKYGIIISKEYKKGLLLPDLEGIETVDEQVKYTKMKAGIDPQDNDVEIYRFMVERYK